jgi:hypothetical protein
LPSRGCSPRPASPTKQGRRPRSSQRCSNGSRTSPAALEARRHCPNHPTQTTWTLFWHSAGTSDSEPSPTTTTASALISNAGEPRTSSARSGRASGTTCSACCATPTDRRSPPRWRPRSQRSAKGASSSTTPTQFAPLLAELTAALREAITRHAEQLADGQHQAVADLEAWEEWSKLDPADREDIIVDAKLVAAAPPDVSTEAKLLEALDGTPLSAWQDRISLVSGRRDQARQRAAKQLEPESVAVAAPSATIKDDKDLDNYVEELRARVQPHLDAEKTVII